MLFKLFLIFSGEFHCRVQSSKPMDNIKFFKFSQQVYNIFLKLQYKLQYSVLTFNFIYIYIYIYFKCMFHQPHPNWPHNDNNNA
jgi:hypothetical protein